MVLKFFYTKKNWKIVCFHLEKKIKKKSFEIKSSFEKYFMTYLFVKNQIFRKKRDPDTHSGLCDVVGEHCIMVSRG